MLHTIYTTDISYLTIWACIGATLGFFTIRNKEEWTLSEKIYEWFLSVTVGVFFALPMYVFLIEETDTSQKLSMFMSGGLSFCITDLIISLWQSIKDSLKTNLNTPIIEIIKNILNRLKK